MTERQIIDNFRRITVRIDVTIGTTTGNGSGLIIDNSGTVLTCHHVVRPYGQVPSRIEVVDENGSRNAQVVKLEQYQDLALLRSDGLRGSCEFRQFEQVEVGDKCLMFGFPLNMPHLSVLQAIISAKGQLSIPNYPYECIQVDGRVNRGNSGGPVVDITTGRVVGIVTAKYIPFLASVEDLQNFVRTNRLPANRGSVLIMGVDFGQFFNALFQMVDLLADALQRVQVGIGYVIPVNLISPFIA